MAERTVVVIVGGSLGLYVTIKFKAPGLRRSTLVLIALSAEWFAMRKARVVNYRNLRNDPKIIV
jgi:hypothetical protein